MTVSCKCDSGKDLRAMAGACADPMRISPGAPPPDDFKNFWDSKTDELKKLPLDVKMTPVDVPANVKGKIEAFDVKINCAGGAPVSGYYARPVGAAKKSLPAVMSYHGAGVRSSGLGTAIDLASRGSIAMDINAHGIENGKPKEFYDDLSKNELRDYRQRNSDDREKCYFLGMFQRVYRSLQFIKSQPEWDGKHLVTTGGSQGGGQSLVAAGLDPDVTLCAAYVPALCDHHGYMQKRKNGWPHFIQMKDGKAADPKVDAASAYFDCANFAPYIKARAILTVGFIDTTCCPSSVYAVYNSIKSPKEIINDPAAGHSVTKIMSDAVNGKINDYLKAAKAENSK
jgi:cephalosporin-C deacetylase-like acetyl esterase